MVTTSGPDPEIEADPEIVELRKNIRKAELEQQLADLKAPTVIPGVDILSLLAYAVHRLAVGMFTRRSGTSSGPIASGIHRGQPFTW